MDVNSNIPGNAFCNIKESIVDLPTPEGVYCNTRQYPHAYHLRLAIDAAVQKWLDDGVIVKALVNTTWNSPLIAVNKTDAKGNKTGIRICADLRQLNRHLPDDKFPIPVIKEIFADLAGAQVYSTLDLVAAYHKF